MIAMLLVEMNYLISHHIIRDPPDPPHPPATVQHDTGDGTTTEPGIGTGGSDK